MSLMSFGLSWAHDITLPMADSNNIPIIPELIKDITEDMINLSLAIIKDFANGLTLKGSLSKSEMLADQFFAIMTKVPELAQR